VVVLLRVVMLLKSQGRTFATTMTERVEFASSVPPRDEELHLVQVQKLTTRSHRSDSTTRSEGQRVFLDEAPPEEEPAPHEEPLEF